MNIFEKPLTTQEIAKHYSAALDSVNLINIYKSSPPNHLTTEEIADAIERNVKHLEIMLAKDFWTTEDLTPLQAAIV
jgi:ribonucleotide reductase alpha subunit